MVFGGVRVCFTQPHYPTHCSTHVPCSVFPHHRFNPSGTLLAATSDALRSLFLFDVASGQATLRVQHARPVLALAWAPWDPHMLAYTEVGGVVSRGGTGGVVWGGMRGVLALCHR